VEFNIKKMSQSFFVGFLFMPITIIFMIMTFSICFYISGKDIIGLSVVLTDGYIVSSLESIEIKKSMYSLHGLMSDILLTSLMAGFVVMVLSTFEKKIDILFDKLIKVKKKEKKEPKILTPLDKFYNGFVYGALILPSILFSIFLINLKMNPEDYMFNIEVGKIINQELIDKIDSYSNLMIYLPAAFIVFGITIGSMFVLANETNNSNSI
jgi:hypothetical protein